MKITQYLAGSLLSFSLASPSVADSVQTIGWIEHVQIPTNDITFTAKIDTGADHSSLNARNIEIYDDNGSERVRFETETKEGKVGKFDLPLLRMANIKRKRAEPIQRPVVSMDLCIGNILKTAQVNLANRQNFKYRMLIGRSFLKDEYLVNPGKKFTAKPACKDEQFAMNDAVKEEI